MTALAFAHQLLNSVKKFEHLSNTTYTVGMHNQHNMYSNRCGESANGPMPTIVLR